MSRLAWSDLERIGLQDLRLHPDAFWRLTPREFSIMAGLEAGSETHLGRAGLAELMQAYPDKKRTL